MVVVVLLLLLLHKRTKTTAPSTNTLLNQKQKTGVAARICCGGRCIPLWVVFPSLQVVLSLTCFVASLSRSPNHYPPWQLQLPKVATADYQLDRGNPSTWCAGLATVHGTSPATPPFEAQRGTPLPRYRRAEVSQHAGTSACPKIKHGNSNNNTSNSTKTW